MSSRLGDVSFVSLLPESIRNDDTVRAAAVSLDALLRKTTAAIPNLLIWARLDRDSQRLFPPLARLVDSAGGLKALSTEQLELLAWQFHVDFREVATDNAMLERMVRESIPWHRIKGTPAAVEEALAMYGVEALVDESGTGRNWAVYELELAEVPRGATMGNIVRVAEVAQAKRCQLRRVYGGYDRRPIILDRGPNLDVGFLDDDSGIWDPETGVKQSFGENRSLWAKAEPRSQGYFGSVYTHGSRAFYVDKAILDHWRLDNPTTKNHGFVGGALITLMSQGIWAEKRGWYGEWGHGKWNELADIFDARYVWSGKWDRRRWTGSTHAEPEPIPRRRIDTHRSLSKAQFVLDGARLDSSLERLDRQRAVVMDNPHRLDAHRLDRGRADLQVRVLYIDERFHESTPFAAGCSLAGPGIGHYRVCASGAQREGGASGVAVTTYREEVSRLLGFRRAYVLPDGTEWTGPWSHRPWLDSGVLISTSEGD